MKNIILILSIFIVSGCDVNIGGAGFDDEKTKMELENFPNFMSGLLSE